MTTMTANTDIDALIERLRERTAFRYKADCKCGDCQIVSRDLLDMAIILLESFPRLEIAIRTAQEENARIREALTNVKNAILLADDDIITDTLWMPRHLWPNETVVDYIDAALPSPPETSKSK